MQVIVLLLLAASLWGQSQLTLSSPGAQPVTGASAVTVGANRGQNIYYWVVARTPSGYTAPSGVVAFNTVGIANLDSSNYVTISWNSVPLATGYDVIRSSTASYPASISCASCAVALNQAGVTFNDQGGALSAYPPGGSLGVTDATGTFTVDDLTEQYPFLNFQLKTSRYDYTTRMTDTRSQITPCTVVSGTANAIVCNGSAQSPTRPPIATLTGAGRLATVISLIPGTTNTGATTINPDGLGAVTVQKLSSGSLTALSSGDLVAGVPYLIRYNGTVFVVDPGSGGGSSSSSSPTYCAPATASATVYACTPSTALSSYTGSTVVINPDVTNAANPTVNVSALGAVNMQKMAGGALVNLAAGDIVAGTTYTMTYNGSVFVLDVRPTAFNLADFFISKTSATVVTVNQSATATSPVVMACGSSISSITAPGTITLTAGSASVTGYLYVNCATGSPVLTFGHNTGNTYTGSGVTIATSITGFPTSTVNRPLWVITGTSGTWDAVAVANDNRSAYGSMKQLSAGSGIALTETAGGVSIASTGGSFVSGILNRQGPSSNVVMTGGGTYDTIFTYTLPANTMGANGCLRITYGATSSGAITLRASFGTKDFDSSLGGATTAIRNEIEVCNTGATNTQSILFPSVGGVWSGTNQNSGAFNGYDTTTQDTTATVAITVKATGVALDTVTPLWFKVQQQ